MPPILNFYCFHTSPHSRKHITTMPPIVRPVHPCAVIIKAMAQYAIDNHSSSGWGDDEGPMRPESYNNDAVLKKFMYPYWSARMIRFMEYCQNYRGRFGPDEDSSEDYDEYRRKYETEI